MDTTRLHPGDRISGYGRAGGNGAGAMTRALRLITWLDSDPGMFVVMMSIVGFVLIALKLTGWE